MKQQDEKILENLGYDTKDKGVHLLNDTISLVEDCMDEYSNEDILDLLYNKSSFIYVELGCYYYEIGLTMFNKELNRVHNNREKNNIDIETYVNIFETNNNPNLEESIISIASYRAKQRQPEANSVVVKRKTANETFAAM